MFAIVGRMALTIYIMQSVICGFIFYGYGLGLHGQVSRTEVMLITVAILAFQLVFALFWFKRFNQGPLEIVWRKTYQKHIQTPNEVAKNTVTS